MENLFDTLVAKLRKGIVRTAQNAMRVEPCMASGIP